jgi:trk system potassium uptake protein TrkH
VIATMSNIGPGLELVGSGTNFDAVPGVGKIFLCFCMLVGRLEIFCLTVMFVPSFWRRA